MVYGENEAAVQRRFSGSRLKSTWAFDGVNMPDGAGYDWMPIPAMRINESDLQSTGRIRLLLERRQAFIQNPSSWLPVLALDPQDGDHILDACAAPGGKTLLMHRLAPDAEIYANDASLQRALKMQRLLEEHGVDMDGTHHVHANVGLAERIGKRIHRQLDKVLIDAPCSGEAEIDLKKPKALDRWSKARIKILAAEQRRIMHHCWALLRAGGLMVYSTCTVAPEENELQVQAFLNAHEDARIVPQVLAEGIPRGPIVETWGDHKLIVSPEVRERAVRVMQDDVFKAFFYAVFQKQ